MSLRRPGRPTTATTARIREIMKEYGCSYRAAYGRWRVEQAAEGIRPLHASDPRVDAYQEHYPTITTSEARKLVEADAIRRHYDLLLSPSGDIRSQRSDELSMNPGTSPLGQDDQVPIIDDNPLLVRARSLKALLKQARRDGDATGIKDYGKAYSEAKAAFLAAGGKEEDL
jgi:hypothetical protein